MACALSQTIDMLITMRFFHGLAAAAASVVHQRPDARYLSERRVFADDVVRHAGHHYRAAGLRRW